jgi:hypothetical protein
MFTPYGTFVGSGLAALFEIPAVFLSSSTNDEIRAPSGYTWS